MSAIIINGIEYIKKSECENMCDDYYIVRTHSAGVFAGYIESRKDKEVVMRKARRIWYWDGAASLSELAMNGTCKPENCKFPCEVEEVILTEVIEIIKCTKKAKDSIKNVKIWSASDD